ncbi:MAG: SPASM domain-containing protein [Lachnospiraceae bacterium]|nr:SPASM domain-containing protein [Lachnospiraceae bacterium]
MKTRREKDFVTCFDEKSGKYIRTGILVDGVDTGKDPFMASFPELLDVGIMGHCIHGKSGMCIMAGVECYQDGLHSDNSNMSIADFRTIAAQCKNQTYQIALGGCGDPDQHENFAELLQICRDNNIVPNFTTSGLGMTPEIVALCKEYCGAVAVSWYRKEYTYAAIDMLLEAGVKTNIHYVLTNNSIVEAIKRLKNHDFPKNINAVIFLLHKPIGLGTQENVILWKNADFRQFIRYIGTEKIPYKIGFDSCTVPAFVNEPGNIDMKSLDTCEGARWSAYITADMKMLPCSFDNQAKRWSVDLRKYTIQEAWNSDVFEDFRNHFRQSCANCEDRSFCMGGCQICPEIVLCNKCARGETFQEGSVSDLPEF